MSSKSTDFKEPDKVVVGNRKKLGKFQEGDKIVCTHSASCGYRVGEEYTVEKDEDGNLGVWARDGYFDLASLLLSSFKVKPND